MGRGDGWGRGWRGSEGEGTQENGQRWTEGVDGEGTEIEGRDGGRDAEGTTESGQSRESQE